MLLRVASDTFPSSHERLANPPSAWIRLACVGIRPIAHDEVIVCAGWRLRPGFPPDLLEGVLSFEFAYPGMSAGCLDVFDDALDADNPNTVSDVVRKQP